MTFGGWKSSGAKSKHGVAKKTPCACGTVHDSIKESKRCADLRMLEIAGSIAGLKQQPRYEFRINGLPVMMENGQCARYTPDFSYVENGRMIAEDVKGKSKKSDSADYPLRKAIFRALYPETELREVRK